MSFSDLSLIPPLLRAVAEEGYTSPTPIQVRAIPHILAGRDLLGLAQTGTGKTAAFALPVLQRLVASTAASTPHHQKGRPVRALIVTPTRELASQIAESFDNYGRHLGFSTTVIFGGVNARPQMETLRNGVDILVATPGRLLDHMSTPGLVRLHGLEVFVLDEADRMLDMGFAPHVKRIINALPKVRQNLFFSATMPSDVRSLAASLLTNPAEVAVVPPATTAEKVAQSVYMVSSTDKRRLLVTLLADKALDRVLVFTRTKHGANRLVDHLKVWGTDAAVIHGNKSQAAREKALAGFKAGKVRVLVATDIAARGIDVDDVSHVINYELPNLPESYVHRIGRTARAGATGQAIAFCAPDERLFLKDIEKTIRQKVPVLDLPEMPMDTPPPRIITPEDTDSQDSRGSDDVRGGRSRGGRGRSGGERGGDRGGQRNGNGRGEARSDAGTGGSPDARPAGARQVRGGRPAQGRPAAPAQAARAPARVAVEAPRASTSRESVPSNSGMPMVRTGPEPVVIRRLPGETLSGNSVSAQASARPSSPHGGRPASPTGGRSGGPHSNRGPRR